MAWRRSILARLALWCVVPAALLAVDPARAEVAPWASTNVRGIVISLVDGRWQEIARGPLTVPATLRTLRGGRLTLSGTNADVTVGPNSLLQLSTVSNGRVTSIDHYAGTIEIVSVPRPGVPQLVVHVGKLTLTNIAGDISLVVAGDMVNVFVRQGSAVVASPNAKAQTLVAGNYSSDADGILAADAGSRGGKTQNPSPPGAIHSSPTAPGTFDAAETSPGGTVGGPNSGNGNNGGSNNGNGNGNNGGSNNGGSNNGNGNGNNGGSNNGGSNNGNGGGNNGGGNNGGNNNGGTNNGNGSGNNGGSNNGGSNNGNGGGNNGGSNNGGSNNGNGGGTTGGRTTDMATARRPATGA